MKTFLVKQKFRLGGERFAIKNDRGEIAYQVEGSFFKIPKTFTIYDAAGEFLLNFLVLRFSFGMARVLSFVRS
ncbi:Protein of uncharacterised function (DUF567) [Streptococcus pneumoniae]|nr:Protein of uncharacterised function (DUF567) [Streptococcus pneumoniae]